VRTDRRLLLWVIGVLPVASAAGCADYRWKYEYGEASALADKEKKTLFIYYRYWLSADCTKMGNEVFNRADVTALFQNTVNCELESSWQPNQELMARYNVRGVPGFVFIGPNGKYVSKTGVMNKEQFVQFAKSAKETAATTQTTEKPVSAGKPVAP
jgi:thioredoxin-related protein